MWIWAATIPVDRLHHFMSYLLINLWWDWFFVPRSIDKINIVSELTVGRSSISQKQDFWQISTWNLSNSSKIQHCTRSQGLPLNTPGKELVDQACLINYAGCDESLKCAGYPTLHCPFCFDFQVSTCEAFALAHLDGLLSISLDSIQFPLMERWYGDSVVLQRNF